MRYLLIPIMFVLGFTGTAVAQSAATGDDGSFLRPLLDALLDGKPGLAAALALVALAAFASRAGAKRWPFLATGNGKALIVLVGSFGGAAAAAISGGAVWGVGLAWSALGVAASAAGGFSLVRRLLADPLLRPLRNRAPAWLRPPLDLLLWAFESPGKAAGDAAVRAKPGGGAAAIVGTPTDVP